MRTKKITLGFPGTEFPATMTDFGGIIRFNPDNLDSLSFRFVLDEELQLIVTPVADPIIHAFPPVLFPYSFEVFHNYFGRSATIDYRFAYAVVGISHEPSFFSAHLLEETFSGLRAFGLQLTAQILVFPLDLFCFGGTKKPAVGSDGEVVYSEVNAKNKSLRTTVQCCGIDLFRERENEKASTFFVYPEQTLRYVPTKIFFVALRDNERDFDPAINSGETQEIVFHRSGTREIVSHADVVDGRLGFSFLDHTASLPDTSNGELCLQPCVSEILVYKWLELEGVLDLVFPSRINAYFQALRIYFEGPDYFWMRTNLDFSTSSCSHTENETQQLYKYYCPGQDTFKKEAAIPPTAKAVGFLAAES